MHTRRWRRRVKLAGDDVRARQLEGGRDGDTDGSSDFSLGVGRLRQDLSGCGESQELPRREDCRRGEGYVRASPSGSVQYVTDRFRHKIRLIKLDVMTATYGDDLFAV
jgi:hypothetical protein